MAAILGSQPGPRPLPQRDKPRLPSVAAEGVAEQLKQDKDADEAADEPHPIRSVLVGWVCSAIAAFFPAEPNCNHKHVTARAKPPRYALKVEGGSFGDLNLSRRCPTEDERKVVGRHFFNERRTEPVSFGHLHHHFQIPHAPIPILHP